jgi:hypothetical protein
MTTQTDYTPEEWSQVLSAPSVAGTLIISSDLSLLASFKESYSIAKAIAGYTTVGGNELVRAIGSAIQGGQRPQMPPLDKTKGSAGVMDTLVAFCKEAADIVGAKSPDELEEYKRFLLDVAQKTAEAGKEGGVLGIGAVRVSEQEKAAIARLAEVLGTPA